MRNFSDDERRPRRAPDTLAAQALGHSEPAYRGLTPAVYPSATYERDTDGSYPGGHSYSRDQNPTIGVPEDLLSQLEGGSGALLFASGMAAATALCDALDDGTHIIAPHHMYWTIRSWFEELAASGRIELTFVENGDMSGLEESLAAFPGRPNLLWVETPSNPMGRITDIAASADLTHRAGGLVACDSTVSTPILTRPIERGADIVFHSATKQLNGHGDVLAGALVRSGDTRLDDLWKRVRHQREYRGAVLGPFEGWLLLRGMRTLHLRVARSASTALTLAERATAHPAVESVLYAGLADHPGHEIACRQMQGGFGPLMSLCMSGGIDAARATMAKLEMFRDATSLGGLESLVEHRSCIESDGTPVPDELIRISVGLEDAEDLWRDLEGGLDSVC